MPTHEWGHEEVNGVLQWDFGENQEFVFVNTLLPNLHLHQVFFHLEIVQRPVATTATRRRPWRQVIVSVGRGVLREQYPTTLASIERNAPPSTIVNEILPLRPTSIMLPAVTATIRCCLYSVT